MDGAESDPVGPDQLPERFQWNRIPRLEDLHFQVLWARGPSVIAIPYPLNHPRPNNLDEVEVRGIGGSRGETFQLPCLFGELRGFVLFTAVGLHLLPD